VAHAKVERLEASRDGIRIASTAGEIETRCLVNSAGLFADEVAKMLGSPMAAISEFKAKCLSLLDEVSKTKTPLRVTRRGKPLADVTPPSMDSEERDWIGSMADRIEIAGDIISPVIETQEIEALK
jgi:prevent-host-death family protein